MKKIFGIACLIAFVAVSCDTEEPDTYSGDFFINFETTSLSVDEDEGTIEVPIVLGAPASSEAVTINYTVTPNDNAVGLYSIENEGTLTIPANANRASISISVEDNGIFDGEKQLSFTITQVTGNYTIGFPGPDKLNSSFTLEIVDNDCPFGDISEWAGNYDVTMKLDFGFIFAAGTYTELESTLTVGTGSNSLVEPDFGYLTFSGRSAVPVTISLDPENLSTVILGSLYNYSNGQSGTAVYAYGASPNERVFANDLVAGPGVIATCTKSFTVRALIRRQDFSIGQVITLTYTKL
jgi:hypothetical protein